jgi:two-component system, chemotaxis family, chemotaxis protein CheV
MTHPSDFQVDIDERTQLAGSNKFELLLFRLGRADAASPAELYGINVFKIREIIPMMDVTAMAGSLPHMMGVVNVRGQVIPVIDLPGVIGCVPQTGLNILLITEFAQTTQAFAVESVEDIVRLDWSQVLAAETRSGGDSLITSIARLDRDRDSTRLAQVLDVETIVRQLSPRQEAAMAGNDVPLPLHPGAVILAADDSVVARLLIEQGLTVMGAPFVMAKTGKEAWEMLLDLAAKAEQEGIPIREKVGLVLTDIEMPEMDGFTLTRKIRETPQFSQLPVVIHSSLTGSANEDHVRGIGANAYVPKFDHDNLSAILRQTLLACA